MLSGILNSRVLCRAFDAMRGFYLYRTFGVTTEFCLRYRCGREVKFYCAEFRSEAPKSRLYKILKPRFYALKFYAHRSLKFRHRGCGLYGAAPNTHSLKFYDRAAEFLQDKALKFYRGAAGKIRVAEEFSKIIKFHRIKFRYFVKFNRVKFHLIAKFYRSAEFKCLQYRKASPSSYARRGFCK
jgi:hypothetical protein